MTIDLTISISLAILAISALLALILFSPIIWQLFKALNTVNHLLDVVQEDLEPIVREISKNVSDVKNKVTDYSSNCKLRFTEVGVSAVSTAHGFLSGLKSYVESLRTRNSN